MKGSKVSFGLGSEEGESSTPREGSNSVGSGSYKAGLTSSEGSMKDNDSLKLVRRRQIQKNLNSNT